MQQKIFSEDNTKFYVAMAQLTGVSTAFKSALLEYFDFDIKQAWTCKREDLEHFCESFPSVKISRTFFQKRGEIEPQKCLDEALEKGYKILTYEDEKYPQILKEIVDFPLSLYYVGDIDCVDFSHTLAIVGSRRASEAAKEALAGIVAEMFNLPITIVSGLAYGIDAQAHKSAIKNGLKTIGVIGCGLDTTYPTSNKELYRQIKEGSGVIFSEYPPTMPPVPSNFPQRNRIVTGLSYGTLVAEAALKSGAMISANLTLEQNRELMCMPGLISNPNCQGIYQLLKGGAGLVTCAQDIFDALGWEFSQSENKLELNNDEKIIYDLIALEPKSFDIITKDVDFEIGNLMVNLTQMELKGLIKQINGKYYISN